MKRATPTASQLKYAKRVNARLAELGYLPPPAPGVMIREADVAADDIPAMADTADAEADRTNAKRVAADVKRSSKKPRKALTVNDFMQLEECEGPMAVGFLLFGGTDVIAEAIFEADDTIHYVRRYDTVTVVRYSKDWGIVARKAYFRDAYAVTAVTAPTGLWELMKVAPDREWMRERTFPQETPPRTGHVNYLKNGRWPQRHVVRHVLDIIIVHMKSHSGGTRNHPFVLVDALRKLREAFINATHCACGRKWCTSVLYLNGPDGISPDRTDDDLGYGESAQVLRLVVKSHNTRFMCDTVPEPRSKPDGWLTVTTGGIHRSYRKRMVTLRDGGKGGKTQEELAQLGRFAKEDVMEALREHIEKTSKDAPATDVATLAAFDADDNYHSFASIQRMLIHLRDTTRTCQREGCGEELCFGDDGHSDKMTLCNVPTRASPDRKENHLSYLGNTRLTCTSCNLSERDYSRVHEEAKRSRLTPLYLLEDYETLCLQYLDGLIEVAQGKGTKKDLRIKLFGTAV